MLLKIKYLFLYIIVGKKYLTYAHLLGDLLRSEKLRHARPLLRAYPLAHAEKEKHRLESYNLGCVERRRQGNDEKRVKAFLRQESISVSQRFETK
jgi:hypothetical protein